MAGAKTGINGQINNNIVTDGLVFYADAAYKRSYPRSGTTWFDIISGNNGTLINGPTFSSDGQGSIVFDGINNYIQGSSLTNYDDGDFSVSVWLYKESGVLYGRVISNSTASSRKGFDIYTINNNVAFTRRTPTKSAATGNVSISYNTWHNVVGTYNDSTGDIKLYLDGVLKITASATSNNNQYSSIELAMGTTATVPYSYFLNGKLSNALIYNRALSAGDVLQNYQAQKERFGL